MLLSGLLGYSLVFYELFKLWSVIVSANSQDQQCTFADQSFLDSLLEFMLLGNLLP